MRGFREAQQAERPPTPRTGWLRALRIKAVLGVALLTRADGHRDVSLLVPPAAD
jgi:hypothetical protein